MSLPPTELGSWYDAGFGDGDGGGDIGRAALGDAPWLAPKAVHVADGRLYWDDGDERLPGGGVRTKAGQGRMVHAKPDLLGRFIDTWDDETGDRISDFAMTFGVLKLCNRGLPVGHARPGPYSAGPHDDCYPTGLRPDFRPYVELEAWRLWARRAMGLLTIAAKLQLSELPDPEHWAVHGTGSRPPGHRSLQWREYLDIEEAIGLERLIAARLINDWLAIGHVHLEARWEEDSATPTARAAGKGLFGALALQLLLTTAKSQGLAICTSCGDPYTPTRKPAAGRDNYCPDCGKQAARREASRRWRAKKRAEKGGV